MNTSAEIRRLRYLAAMDVPVYVTRRVLPGAALTRKLALKNPSAALTPTTAAVQDTQTPASQRSRPHAQALRESLRQAPVEIGRERVPATPPPPTSRPDSGSPATADTAATPTAAVRFRLAAVVCAQRLWLEELGEEALAQEQLQLLAAMGYALMHPKSADAPVAVTEFQWPMHENLQLDLGPEEAKASLQGFLQRHLEDNGCVELICLGGAASSLLKGLRLPCASRHLPSSREVLGNPAIKRDLWQALRS
jgi:hypothetical protein